MRESRLLGLAASTLMLACCQPDAVGPPSLRIGQEACAQCRMIISDERFAAALTTEEGETAKFDDVGCLVEHESGRFAPATAYWVRDFKAEVWLDARAAAFVRSKSIASPMGFNLAAFGSSHTVGEFNGDPSPRTFQLEGLPELIASDQVRDDGPSTAAP